MCEFCAEHAEGRKWYLEMKNYSQELLLAQLTGRERRLAQVETRLEWVRRFLEEFVLPAAGVKSERADWGPGRDPAETRDAAQILEDWKTVHFGQILPVEDVPEVLGLATSITRIPCGCRFLLTGKTDQRYCFGLGLDQWGIMGKYPDASASLETMERDEALAIVREFDREGLVHSIWTGMTPYVVGLCNCDRDCGAYRTYIENRGRPTFFRAEYVCEVDWDLCTGCKSCMKQCQFHALFYSSANGKVYINPTHCFGCGVCRAICPTGAIKLRPRQEHSVARDIWLQAPAARR